MPLYNFQQRFAPDVQHGRKRQTIRRRRSRPTKQGETLYLYSGLRTAAAHKLGEARCVAVSPVLISDGAVSVDGEALPREFLDEFARADGFAGADEFFEFFRKTYGLSPFKVILDDMELIEWEPLRMSQLEIGYLGGLCPVQAGGKIGDRRFYFKSRGASWKFFLADPGGDPIDCVPLRTGTYGPWPQAGYMPQSTARSIIYRIAREIEEQKLK